MTELGSRKNLAEILEYYAAVVTLYESIGSVNQIPLAQIQYFYVEIKYNNRLKNCESKRGYETYLYCSDFDGNGSNQ